MFEHVTSSWPRSCIACFFSYCKTIHTIHNILGSGSPTDEVNLKQTRSHEYLHSSSKSHSGAQVDVQEEVEEGEVQISMAAAERVALLNQLPPELGPAAQAAVDKANGSNLQVTLPAAYDL